MISLGTWSPIFHSSYICESLLIMEPKGKLSHLETLLLTCHDVNCSFM